MRVSIGDVKCLVHSSLGYALDEFFRLANLAKLNDLAQMN